jgi:hypothetical protein
MLNRNQTQLLETGIGVQKVNRPEVRFCKPFKTKQELEDNNWRNREVFKILHELDPNQKYIYIAKFHEITAGRHDLHAIGTDCTHFCPSPILWYPLWQELFDIIDGHFKNTWQQANTQDQQEHYVQKYINRVRHVHRDVQRRSHFPDGS